MIYVGLRLLASLNSTLEKLVTQFETQNKFLADLRVLIGKVITDQQTLKGLVKNSMTDEEVNTIKGHHDSVIAAMQALDEAVPDPITPTEPPVMESKSKPVPELTEDHHKSGKGHGKH